MKNLSNRYLESTSNKTVLTLAECFKVKLKNGKILGFTTSTRDVKFKGDPDNIVYKSKGFSPTSSSKTSTFSVDNIDVEIIIDNKEIFTDDLEKGLFDNAEIFYFRYNWLLKPLDWLDIEKIDTGYIGEVTRNQNTYKAEFRSLTQRLQNNVTNNVTKSCLNKFCDNICSLNKDDYTETDTINKVINSKTIILNTLDFDDDYFNNGVLEFVTGLATGKTIEIKKWTKDTKTIEIQLPLGYTIKSGDEVKVTRGCMKTIENCLIFDNILNFNGFPFIPSLDKITGGNQ